MIFHKYSRWEEPEEPPFTLEELIRAAVELMMRHHVEFNEALRYLIDQGLPVNEFLRSDGLDAFFDENIARVERMKEDLRAEYDLDTFIRRRRRRLADLSRSIRDRLASHPGLREEVRIASRSRRSSGFYSARWRARADERLAGDETLLNMLSRAVSRAEFLEEAEDFHSRSGKEFHGKIAPDDEAARALFRRYKALDDLQRELEEARDRGDLFGVEEERLREMLGEEAYDEFMRAREEALEKLSERLEATGQVVEEDGVFKLTPAAARKVGERALREVFGRLKIDGLGAHTGATPGEGAVESVNVRPYQFGDSLAHLDLPGSMVNALVRNGAGLPIRLGVGDMETHETYGSARTAMVVMMDMSGSMSRLGRFYNARKVALALDAMIRSQYPDDSLHFVGFATFARRIAVGEIINLGPEPVTFAGGGVKMRVDFAKVANPEADLRHVPRYFTNLQKGLELARRILNAERGRNKEIILITDGAPTAYYEGRFLNLSYPPDEKTYSATLREVRAATEDGITITSFLLGSDFDTGFFGEGDFVRRMHMANRGRMFHPAPESLTKYVLVDYMANKRKLIEI